MSAMLCPESPTSDLQSGDAPAPELSADERFTLWIAPEVDFVQRVSRRFSKSAAEGEDLAQEVLARAYRFIDKFDGRYPRAWLHRIISNTAASRARKRRLVEVSLDATFDRESGQSSTIPVVAEGPTPDVEVVAGMLDPVLEQAMEGLAPHYRSVIDLVDLGGATYEEAAEQLEVPIGTVMSRLHRGRGKLRSELAGSHLDRSVATQSAAAPPV